MWSASGTGTGDDLRVAVKKQIAGCDSDTTGDIRRRGVEAAKRARNLLAGDAVEDPHVRSTTGTGARDDVREAVTGDIAGGNVDAAGESHVIGVEGPDHRTGDAVEDLHEWRPDTTGTKDDVRDSIAVDIGGSDMKSAAPRRRRSGVLADKRSRPAVERA